MKTFIGSVVKMTWSFLIPLLLFTACGPDKEKEQRCRNQFNQCMQACRERATEATNVHHAESLECSNTLIAALNACDANNAPNSKGWTRCMIDATEAYQRCYHASKTKYDLAMLAVMNCETECELNRLKCMYGE